MASGNVPNGIGHGENGKSKRQSDAKKAYSYLWKSSCENRATTTAQDQHEGAQKFSTQFFREAHIPFPIC